MSQRVLLVLLLLATLIGGCRRVQVVPASELARPDLVKELPIVGQWSDPVAGLRCRIRLDADTVMETDTVRLALEIQNAGTGALRVRDGGCGPFDGLLMRMLIDGVPAGNQGLASECATPSAFETKLAHGQVIVVGPVNFYASALPGPRTVSARESIWLNRKFILLDCPPLDLHITPAQWGETKNGLRCRISAKKQGSLWIEGSGSLVRFIHNINPYPVLLPDMKEHPSGMLVDDDLITLVYEPDAARRCNPHYYLSHKLCSVGGLPTDHRSYRLRIAMEIPPNGPYKGNAWHGRLVSNEMVIHTSTKADR